MFAGKPCGVIIRRKYAALCGWPGADDEPPVCEIATGPGRPRNIGFAEGKPGEPMARQLAVLSTATPADAPLAIGNLPPGLAAGRQLGHDLQRADDCLHSRRFIQPFRLASRARYAPRAASPHLSQRAAWNFSWSVRFFRRESSLHYFHRRRANDFGDSSAPSADVWGRV